MKQIIDNWQSSVCGMAVLGVAAILVIQGRMDWVTFTGAVALAGGLLAAKDAAK